mmetsp:Transcript_10623/g.26941  ORF Transcript_10623/g.26941 Transcript_10623/m.26941 type:complete len:330 (+) Transcript_10623:548-1537(+)
MPKRMVAVVSCRCVAAARAAAAEGFVASAVAEAAAEAPPSACSFLCWLLANATAPRWCPSVLSLLTIACPDAPKTSSVSTFPYVQGYEEASGLMAPTTCSRCFSSVSFTMSLLLSSTISAHSTCSTSRSTTRLCPLPPCASFPPRSGLLAMTSRLSYSCRNADVSTTVTSVSSVTRSMIGSWYVMASLNLSLIACGSATPLVSMMMRSYLSPLLALRESSLSMLSSSSSEAVQHAHPFCSSTVSAISAVDPPAPALACMLSFLTSFASMLTAATSLTMSPIFIDVCVSSCLSSVVFPAPRNPLMSEMGTTCTGCMEVSPMGTSKGGGVI